MTSPIGKRATRFILASISDILAEELPLISYELVMETFDQEGGARMYRLTHSLSPLDKPVYVVVTAEVLDENGAQRRIPPHDAEGVSDIDPQLPPVASRFPGINYRGPQGDPVGRMLPPLPPDELRRLLNDTLDPTERWDD